MNTTPDPAPDVTRSGPVADRTLERLDIHRRRKIVARMRFVESKTERQIRDALTKLDPPIHVGMSTIGNDIEYARGNFRKYFGNREAFDAPSEVAKILSRFEYAAMLCLKRARTELDNGKFAALMRVFNESNEKYQNLLQNVGLVDKRLGTLFIQSTKKAEAVPTGSELQKLFEDVDVVDGEIISSAEKDWLYGQVSVSEDAARSATAGVSGANNAETEK
jgi:hypothetical protein